MKAISVVIGLALIVMGAVNCKKMEINEGLKIQEDTDKINLN